MLSCYSQNMSTFAAHSFERLSTAVVNSPIPRKSRLSFMDRVLRSRTSSDSPAFSFLGLQYRLKSGKKFKLYLLYNDYETSYTTYINHARWHRCLRSNGLRVGGKRSTRMKHTCLTWYTQPSVVGQCSLVWHWFHHMFVSPLLYSFRSQLISWISQSFWFQVKHTVYLQH